MTAIAVNPLFMSECTFSVATDSFEAALSSVTFTPANTTATWKGLAAGSVFTKSGKSTWTCQIAFAQDFGTAGSLSNYLLANEGEQVTVTFVPDVNDDTSPTITATLIVVPGSIGGAVDAFATSTVTLPVLGKPTITPHA